MRYHLLVVLVSLVWGCGTSSPPGPSYPARSTIELARTAACEGGRCSCSRGEQEPPEPGNKRFEFRLPRSTSAIWVEVQGKGVYYKAPEQLGPSCFYVDLPPGQHRLAIHAKGGDPEVGLQAGLTVHEYGAKAGYWYRVLHFVCGGLNRCTSDDLRTWAGFQRGLPRGVLDPCGSTMVRGVSFGGTKPERKRSEYEDVTVRAVLKAYQFEPEHPPRSPTCKAPVKNL